MGLLLFFSPGVGSRVGRGLSHSCLTSMALEVMSFEDPVMGAAVLPLLGLADGELRQLWGHSGWAAPGFCPF